MTNPLDPNYDEPDEPDFTEDVKRLINVAKRAALVVPDLDLCQELTDAVLAVEYWDEDDDPRAMGWVSDSGLP